MFESRRYPDQIAKNKTLKSRGALYLLKEVWYLKPDVGSLENVMRLIGEFSGTRDDLILSAMDYVVNVVPGISRKVWETAERVAVLRQRRLYEHQREI